MLTSSTAALAADYYLGSSAAAQSGTAIQSISALNQLALQPGDRVFFQAGETFQGPIELTADDAGTPDQPIELSSFGEGRATIDAGNGSAIVITNAGGIRVRNLDLLGTDKSTNTGSGIDAGAYFPDSRKLDHLRFEQMRISGFRYGVEIWAWHSTDTIAWPGFRGVILSELDVFDNLSEGIRVWGAWQPDGDGTNYSHADFRVSACVVRDNRGDPNSTVHTGSGIVLSGVDGAVIENCVAHDNGGLGPASGGGPFGIWVFEARNCTLQHNLVYRQKTSSRADGGAFDLDGGAVDCVVQYNYSYENDGPAVGVIQFDDASPLGRNVVRYNISENDCRAHPQGVLYVGQFSATQGIDGVEFHGNTVFVSANASGENPPAVHVEDHAGLSNVRLRNNLFVATHNGPLLGGVLTKPTVALYQGNNYWGGMFDLAEFRQAGQEMLEGEPVGLRTDPKLRDAGGGGMVLHPADFSQLSGYQLQSDSPVARAGLDLTARFGLDPGPRDFFGEPLSASALPIGASARPLTAAPPVDDVSSIRVVNLSLRSEAGPDSRTLILGFVIEGAGAQDVLLRGVAPGLATLENSSDVVVADPRLTLFQEAVPLGGNEDWGGGETMRTLFGSLGAFALEPASKDAALSRPLARGLYTAHLTSADNIPALALVEVYDATKSGETRFVNVSARTQVGTGANVAIAGFVLEGTGEKTLLLRGAGPSLVKHGVGDSSVLHNPMLTLYVGPTAIRTNDDWGGTTELKSVFTTVGAFDFDADTSADAALLVTLGAGLYTVHLSGVNNTTGVGLVEIYVVP